jgi:plastocyanin
MTPGVVRHARLALSIIAVVVAGASARPVTAQAGRTGTIVGHVRLMAAAPPSPPIRMGADPACAAIYRARGETPVHPLVIRSADGGLANAFIDVEGTFPATPVPSTQVVLDQKDCMFSPRVMGARAGQTLEIHNSDRTSHNAHATTSQKNAFNISQPVPGMVTKVALKSAERMLRVRCDIHGWMLGYIGVMPHPYWAVSDTGGAFRIASVPAGRHTIRIWHERYGEQTMTVTVQSGQTATVDFTYLGSERPQAALYRELVIPG